MNQASINSMINSKDEFETSNIEEDMDELKINA
jgi:hypothetical protein